MAMRTTDAELPPSIVPLLDPEAFRARIELAPGLAVVDFTAEWCPPCRALAPHIEALARELGARISVAKVDVDEHPELASRFGVLSMPTLLFFRNGQIVDRAVGAMPLAALRARVAELERPLEGV